MLRLDSPTGVTPAPISTDPNLTANGAEMTFYGWGQTGPATWGGNPSKAPFQSGGNQGSFDAIFVNGVGNPEPTLCPDDAGGGFTTEVGASQAVVAIALTQTACDPPLMGAHPFTADLVDWIEAVRSGSRYRMSQYFADYSDPAIGAPPGTGWVHHGLRWKAHQANVAYNPPAPSNATASCPGGDVVINDFEASTAVFPDGDPGGIWLCETAESREDLSLIHISEPTRPY